MSDKSDRTQPGVRHIDWTLLLYMLSDPAPCERCGRRPSKSNGCPTRCK